MNWKQHFAVPDLKYFPSPHNQYMTGARLIQIIKKFNLITKVREIVTNSVFEMQPAMKLVMQFRKEN